MYKKLFPHLSLIISAISVLFCFFAPVNFIFKLIFLSVIFSVLYFYNKRKAVVARWHMVRRQELEEKINILNEELKEKNTLLYELPSKAKKVFSITNISEELINFIDPEKLCEFLVKQLYKVFPEAEVVALFKFDQEQDTVILNNSVRKNKEVLKEKCGDILEWWVLRKNQCLIIDDLSTDYRFDIEKSIAFKERKAASILSSPLSIGNRILGVIRLESSKKRVFSLEDLRAVRIICDLAAVVLEKAKLFQKTEELAIKDSLTSLFLRNYFFDRLKEEIKRSTIKKSNFGIVMLDIDDFKNINDTYGHTVGDIVLKKIADLLVKNVGNSGNIVCRLGGEEFIFLIVESEKEDVLKIAEKIRNDIEETSVDFRRKKIKVTASFGLAMFPEDATQAPKLAEVVDKLLYKAKRKGKNKICYM